MKKYLIAFTCILFFEACGNTEEQETTTTVDTTAQTIQPEQPQQQQDPMMTAMHSMMQDMQNMQMSGDPDKDFAMMMKRHHQAAIEMAKHELQNGTDSTIKRMAQKMQDEQSKESQELEQFASSQTGTQAPDTSFGGQMMQSMDKMHQQMMSPNISGNTDKDFVTMMIPHHQSAVDMSQAYLSKAKNPRLKAMANKMIKDQKKEIEEMNKWLQSH